jgi:hypothetical protein
VRAWFYREAGFTSIAPDEAVVLLRRLVGTLPEPERGVARLLDTVESAYRESGMFSPEWVKRVRQVVAPTGSDEGRRTTTRCDGG